MTVPSCLPCLPAHPQAAEPKPEEAGAKPAEPAAAAEPAAEPKPEEAGAKPAEPAAAEPKPEEAGAKPAEPAAEPAAEPKPEEAGAKEELPPLAAEPGAANATGMCSGICAALFVRMCISIAGTCISYSCCWWSDCVSA